MTPHADATPNTKIRVMIVDDHEIVRIGLSALINESDHIEVVGVAGTAAAAIEMARELTPDVVLMDLRLPDDSGVVACREILAHRPATRVIFLSAFEEDLMATAAVHGGAAGYLVKDLDQESLLRAITTVMDGQAVIDSRATREAASARIREAADTPGRRRGDLSPQERKVLELVVQGKTNPEIAKELELSAKTVKNYLSNVFQKLGVGRRAHAAAVFSLMLAGREPE